MNETNEMEDDMSEDLKPGAYRVFDTVERRYLEDGERDDSRESPNSRRGPQRFLSLGPDGSLSFLMDYDCGRMDDSDAEAMAPGRYLVERWTGLYDREGRAVYEGDMLYGCWYSDPEMLAEVQHVGDGFRTRRATKNLRNQRVAEGGLYHLADDLEREWVVVGTKHDRSEVLLAAAREARKRSVAREIHAAAKVGEGVERG